MSPRAEAFASLLKGQLARIGRSDTTLALDERFAVTLHGRDGDWSGPGPAAFGAMIRCSDGAGSGPDFWGLFPTVPRAA